MKRITTKLLGILLTAAAPQGGLAASGDPEPARESALTYTMDDRHELHAGDTVSLRIVEDREEAKTFQVADSGELEAPYIGRVQVSGLTCKQLSQKLKQLLEVDYYYQATVIVGLEAISKVPRQVYLWGQISKQGPIEIPDNGDLSLGKAILMAGGFGSFADKKKVRIIRKAREPGGEDETIVVNLVDVLEKGKTDQDVQLQPEDMIYVPQRLVNF